METTGEQESQKNLSGLRGWLIPVGILVVASPVAFFLRVVLCLMPFLSETPGWDGLMTPGSQYYNPLYVVAMLVEFVLYSLLFLLAIFSNVAYFKKRRVFPLLWIIILIAQPILLVADSVAMSFLWTDAEMFDVKAVNQIIRKSAMVLIWVPYLLISKRVKQTFVR